MIDESGRLYRTLSTSGLAVVSLVVVLWAGMQGLMQLGGLLAGGSAFVVSWLVMSYTLLPLSGVAIAWWRWAVHRHAQAWVVLVVIGAALQFFVGPVFAA